MDAAGVLQALVRSDSHLSGQSIMHRIDRGADHSREARLNQHMATDYDEYSGAAGILVGWMRDAIEVAPLHRAIWKSSTSAASRFKRAARRLMIVRSRLV